jgi:protein TonB
MTTFRDTLETSNSTAESAGSSAAKRPKSESGHLRTDAVSLEVPVKVHGSRVTQVVRGITPHTEPFEEQTATMIVFPQGGVLRMTTAVSAGQAVVVTNLRSQQDAICRVMKVRAYGEKQSYVEIEFTHPQPRYWGVYFPSDGPEVARKGPTAPPALAAVQRAEPKVEIHARENAAPEISWAPAPTSAPKPAGGSPSMPAPTQKRQSAFAQIESREEVQPAASSTAATIGDPFAARAKTRTAETAKDNAAAEIPAAPPSSLSITELRGDARDGAETIEELTASLSPDSSAERPAATFGRFAASASLGARDSATTQDVGAHIEFGVVGASSERAKPRSKGLLIATCVAASLAIAAGAAFYLRNRPFTHSVATPTPPVATVETTAPASSSAVASNSAHIEVPPPPMTQTNAAISANVPTLTRTATAPGSTVHVIEAAPARPAKASAAEPIQPVAPVRQNVPSPARDVAGALNAHPVSPKHANAANANADLSIDAGSVSPNPGAGLSGVGSSPMAVPPPPQPVATILARTGGEVKPPKLIYSSTPVYPTIARQAGVEGTVVVNAVVGLDGKVTNAKAVSGPVMLRAAALEAVIQRKYEPSTLDGQPTAVQVVVAIQFHR